MVRYGWLVAAIALLAAGCGGATPAAAKAKGPIGSDAPVLVEMAMQRPGALLDKITIHADGYGLFDRPSGGVGRVQRDVVIEKAVLRRLRAGLLIRYRGRTLTGRRGGIVPAARPAVQRLDGLINGIGIRSTTRERSTHEY